MSENYGVTMERLAHERDEALAKLANAQSYLTAYQTNGVTEEILRRHDGCIKLGKGCAIVVEADFVPKARLAAAEAALQFYADETRWFKFEVFGGIDENIQEGDQAMGFKDGEDHPWSIAQDALSITCGQGWKSPEEHAKVVAERDALNAILIMPENYCLACGGDGGHAEGCSGTTGLIALSAQLAAANANYAALKSSADMWERDLTAVMRMLGMSVNDDGCCEDTPRIVGELIDERDKANARIAELEAPLERLAGRSDSVIGQYDTDLGENIIQARKALEKGKS